MMFVKKKEFEKLKEIIDNSSAIKTYDISSKITSCEKCGCLVYETVENRGKPEIRDSFKQEISNKVRRMTMRDYSKIGEHYIYYPYYCKIHKPKHKLPITPKNKR